MKNYFNVQIVKISLWPRENNKVKTYKVFSKTSNSILVSSVTLQSNYYSTTIFFYLSNTFDIFTLSLFNPHAVIISNKQSAFELFRIFSAGVLI